MVEEDEDEDKLSYTICSPEIVKDTLQSVKTIGKELVKWKKKFNEKHCKEKVNIKKRKQRKSDLKVVETIGE